jgi:raffinose/stachyose/melibiose transport system substrate-binding protein
MLANRKLLEEILAEPENAALAVDIGPDLAPRTFDQFIALCDAARSWADRTGTRLIPIAANKESGRVILDHSVGSQNQRLLLEWPVLKDTRVVETTFLDRLARGEEIWTAPAFRHGLEVLREIGLRTQPGFMQLRQEDSNFAFATGHALMIYGSSMSASSLRSMTGGTIEMVAFPIPFPDASHPRFGRYSMGPISEADMGGGNPFGVVNYMAAGRQELALDFLRFLSSFEANQTFTRLSGQVPVIAGVEPGELARPFALRLDGYKVGPPLYMGINDVRNLLDTHLHRIVSPKGGVEAFLEEAPPAMIARAVANLRTACNGIVKTSSREDPLIASFHWLRTFDPDAGADVERRLSLRIDANDGNECDAAMRLPRLEWYVANGARVPGAP